MPSFNKVILMGHLTRDPELRYTQSGKAVCNMGLAVSEKYKDKEEVCFIDITVWDKQAESCNQYLSKGRPVLVEGKLRFDTWENTSGEKRNKHGITALRVVFLGDNSKKEQSSGLPANDAPAMPGDDEIPF